MSLLDDLRGIDLSAIVSARGQISTAISSPDLQSLLSGGAAQTALAGLGGSIASLRGQFADPSALLGPIVDAVGGLKGHMSIEGIPVDRYLTTVSEGIRVAATLVDGLDRDPLAVGRVFGASVGDQLGSLTKLVEGYTHFDAGAFNQLRTMLGTADGSLPTNGAELAHVAVDLLLPFPRASLLDIRGGLDGILSGLGQISLPAGRTSGLLAAFDAAERAASAGNAAGFDEALRTLAQARANTVQVLQQDLLRVFEQIGRLQIGTVIRPMAEASRVIQAGRTGVLEFLGDLHRYLRMARDTVEGIDPEQVGSFLETIVNHFEAEARAIVVAPIEAQVKRLEAFFRDLFRRLPLKALRAEITAFIHSIAIAIQNAGLDGVVQAMRDALGTIGSIISGGGLTGQVQQAVQQAAAAINSALDAVLEPLEAISQRINEIAGEAQQILDRAADAIAGFARTIDEARAAIDGLGIGEAADQVIATLRALREKASALLSQAPLPEPMRPLVEQLISTLDNVDFDVVFQPVRSIADQLKVPPEVADGVKEALAKVKEVLDNLIPQELIASLEAEISQALDAIRKFDPSSLLTGLTEYVEDAARFIEGLDPRPLVGQIRAPFQAVLDAIDSVEPRRLLRPVIDAYDQALSHIQLPSAEMTARRFGEMINASGNAIGEAVTAPSRSLLTSAPAGSPPAAGGGAGGGGGGAAGAGGGAGAGGSDPLPFRPGDVIRIFGYVPSRLREVLQGLASGPAGEVVRGIDGLTSGLAADLRRLQSEFDRLAHRIDGALEQLLMPLGQAQVRAQLSVRANFAGGNLSIDAATAALANAGPGALRHELAATLALVRRRIDESVAVVGGSAGAALESAASALDGLRLSSVGGSLDGLLAALDPEPLAAELDELVRAAFARAPALLTAVQDRLQAALAKLRDLIEELNPAAQAQKFLSVLDVLKSELDVLNPGLLADELGEVHGAIRRTIAAYDPAVLADSLFAVIQQAANALRALNPVALLGDLSPLNSIAARVEQAVPTQALAGVGDALTAVGERLAALDPGALLEAIGDLAPRIVEQFEAAVEDIRNEVVALLEAIRYANANASVSVSASAGAG